MVATPIGNLKDITLRAVEILSMVPVVACEDTRHTGLLFKLLKIPNHPKFISVRDWNEAQMVVKVLAQLQNGDVALVSDGGTPLISDPGYKIVRAAREAGFTISPIPGPSAALAALSVGGLPTNKFMFVGFWNIKQEILPGVTTVIFESPERLEVTLKELKNRYPDAEVVLARELTKLHEYVGADDGLRKGEVTILVNYGQTLKKEWGRS